MNWEIVMKQRVYMKVSQEKASARVCEVTVNLHNYLQLPLLSSPHSTSSFFADPCVSQQYLQLPVILLPRSLVSL